MRFANPLLLLLLPVLPVMAWYYIRCRHLRVNRLKFSSLGALRGIPGGSRLRLRHAGVVLRVISLALFIMAFARPQAGQKGEEVLSRGVDIILCLDTSTSMRSMDFKPLNRLDAAKQAAKEFVEGRKNDRIGVVVFSELSFTQCPLTLDYGAVTDFLENVEIGMTQTDGTAIGTALITCVNRLKESEAKSKVIILLTDGRNTMGKIDPVMAAQAAEAMDIKIYTIGAGAPGGAMMPYDDPIFGRRYIRSREDLDEDTLIKIAAATGGKYFRATGNKKLKEIYSRIDKMEKTDIKVQEYTDYTELFPWFILPGLLLLLCEIILANTYLRKVP